MSIIIHQINVARSNARMHTILNHDSSSHIILFQEPYIGRIASGRSFDDPTGTPIIDTVAHPGWISFLPTTHPSIQLPPRVATFVCRNVAFSFTQIFSLTKHFDLLALKISFNLPDTPPLLILNCYIAHPSDHNNALQALMSIPFPSHPFLICGDFNRHHSLWSLPNQRPSSSLNDFMNWIASYQLSLINTPLIPTRRRLRSQSVIDLSFVDPSFSLHFSPITWHASFDPVLSSDHANILIKFTLPSPLPPLPPSDRWSIKQDLSDQWISTFLDSFSSTTFPLLQPQTY